MMRRVMLLVGVPLVSAFVGTLLAIAVALPTLVEAQETRMRADVWSLVGAGEKERVRIATGPLHTATVAVLSTDGMNRANVTTGGTGGLQPNATGFNLQSVEGLRIGRLGTATTHK
jgi:ABC-type uncharacterized transport system permease subunit